MRMAGGGVKGGCVHGAMDEFGFAAIKNEVHVHDLHATLHCELNSGLAQTPQYCSDLQGLSENAGNSTIHSLQAKAAKRFSRGLRMLTSYTLAKLIASADNNQPDS